MGMPTHDLVDLIIKGTSGVGVVIASALAVSKYRSDADAEFRKPLWAKQLELYFEACKAASTIAVSPPRAEQRHEEEKTFWMLYWGPLALIEDEEVARAMVKFGDRLDAHADSEELKELSLKLAKSCRQSIGSTWNFPLAQFNVRR
jgi:hypothetical protein